MGEIINYILIIITVISALFIWGIINKRSREKKLKIQLLKQWGDVPQDEYTSEKYKSIAEYYYSIKDDTMDVDDITWNDVDMDEIYMMLNNTQSAAGEEYLYAILRKPLFSNEELQERNRLVTFFQNKEEQRVDLQVQLNNIGKLHKISAYEYINRLDELKFKSNIPHYIMAFGLLISIILIFIVPSIGGLATFAFAINNIIQYLNKKGKIEHHLTLFAFILRILDGINGIAKLDIPELKSYCDDLVKASVKFRNFKRGSIFVTAKNVSNNIIEIVFDYFRMLFHIDLIKFNSMLSFLKKNQETLISMYTNIGLLDSMIAVASFRTLLDYYCEPELVESDKPILSATDLYHPILEEPVVNSISEEGSVLVTGSNASGKSTFIKALAVNAILSQTIYTSLCTNYRASFFVIYSSMALRDNIFKNESYYIVEIKSLKRILDRVNPKIPVLCFIDEVLRGTNTLERIAASSRILASLAEKNTMVIAATHDIELTYILERYYSNYHFQEQIINDQIEFDYKLYPGRAVSRNAIKLLSLIGYSQEIINASEQAANDFLEKGEWAIID
ncbi:MAG: hypothetical protein GX288_11715 [Clostridiales bacterium]|nr:hypothetical protein [Clostridiales bacterium]